MFLVKVATSSNFYNPSKVRHESMIIFGIKKVLAKHDPLLIYRNLKTEQSVIVIAHIAVQTLLQESREKGCSPFCHPKVDVFTSKVTRWVFSNTKE